MNKIVNVGKIVKEEKTNNKSFKFFTIIIIVFMVILLFLGGYSLAKTIEQIIVKSNIQIAEPILIVENNPSIDITATKNSGVYSFKIKNYNEINKITETNLKYYIEILANTDKSVTFKIYENEQEMNLNQNKTDYIKISRDSKEEKQYKIEILYDKDKSVSVNDIIQEIQVKIHTEQEKG